MGDYAILGGYPATMTVSGFLTLAGLTGVIVHLQSVASLTGFEGDKGQCKIMAVHQKESCKGHDSKKSSGTSKEAAKGSYTFDYDVTVLSPEVCPNTTIRYDHTQGSIWCDTVPDHPLGKELACWYEHDCSKVWFKDPADGRDMSGRGDAVHSFSGRDYSSSGSFGKAFATGNVLR